MTPKDTELNKLECWVQRKMIKIFNDTKEVMTLRVHHKGALPVVTEIEPQMGKAIFNINNDVLIKVWDNNVVLVQELDSCNKTNSLHSKHKTEEK